MNEMPPLPLRSCIVTNVGHDRQRFMMSTTLGMSLMEEQVGSTLDLFTGEQLDAYALQHAASILARAEAAEAGERVAQANCERLTVDVERLRAELRPFAEIALTGSTIPLSFADYVLRARHALKESTP